ncbi:MAG: hypothetical protein AAF660_02740 [Pseudomonadota bacterium]
MRKVMKFLHTTGSLGVAGGLAAFMLILHFGPPLGATAEYAHLREILDALSSYIILPSMALVMLSGVLAMAVHFPFQSATWVWIKLLTGFLILESMLATLDAPSRDAAAAARDAVVGNIKADELPAAVQDHWFAWWVLLSLALGNVGLAIWRPRFRGKPS